jgi:hypothetical protein
MTTYINLIINKITMSSTNRSNARESHVADYYVTPIRTVISFIQEFQMDE